MEHIILGGFDTWIIVKVLALVLLGMYLVFALVVTKQVSLMIKTLNLGFNAPIRFMALLHLLFAIVVFIAAFMVL